MSQQQDDAPRISKFLHEYRKKLSLLKIKSFYANHLCKRNCLEGKLNINPQPCFNTCDQWLKGYYQIKKNKAPQQAQNALFEVQKKYESVKKNEDIEYQKLYACSKFDISNYVKMLQDQLDKKINQQLHKK